MLNILSQKSEHKILLDNYRLIQIVMKATDSWGQIIWIRQKFLKLTQNWSGETEYDCFLID